MADMEFQDRKRDLRYIIIGAGMAGILAAIRLKEAGDNNFIVYEKGDKLGGTWRDNRYPGLTCDVPAHAYTYSFAPNPDWSAFFSPGPEIREYFENVAVQYGVRDTIRLNTEVMRCEFSDADGRWHVTLQDGTADVADIVIAATGVLHHPNVPDIPGLKDFKGAAFHSARWDDSVPLDDRRIGVVGTGSTGVQIVSALSTRASNLVHFSRSPQWIMPVANFPYNEDERKAFREDVAKIDAIRYGEEYWGGIRRFNKAIIEPESSQMHEIEEIVSKNLEESVRDPVLREKLRPNYRAACKRLVYSPDYYDAVQRSDVHVETGAIEQVEENGIRMKDGTLHELDVIALATGFKADRFVRPMVVTGRGGRDLDKVWERRPSAFLAVSIPDFPNLFLLNGPTGPVGNFSLIDIAERQWGYISHLLNKLRAGECTQVSASHDAMADYEVRRIDAAKKTVFGSGCSSWYLDAEGVPSSWPWSYDAFAEAMEAPQLENYELR